MSDYEKLTHRELDAAVAEKVMGICIHEWDTRIIPACVKCGANFMKIDHAVKLMTTYSTDDNAARLVRDRIASLGVEMVEAYQRALAQVVYSDESMISSKFHGAAFFAFTLQDATPRQQCLAALMALEAKPK